MQQLVIMGVSGCGKSTLAGLLAQRLGRDFAEADDFHPPVNIERMRAGIPLDDADRLPWLISLREWLTARTDEGREAVVTCSALRRSYRDVLREARGDVVFVHLVAPTRVIADRLASREGHFMPASLLPSQVALLEPLGVDEPGFTISADASPQVLCDLVLARLGLPVDPYGCADRAQA